MSEPLRVLIVEDNEDDAALMLRELERGGFAPVWVRVETHEAMIDALQRQPWDIVVSDYSLPSFSGPEALRIVKERSLDVPFIIVSGSIGEEVAVEAMRAGADDYILKDRMTRLPVAVARELREAEARRANARSQAKLQAAEQRLDTATQQLLQAEKLTALGELVAGVAHEINNPLSTLLGYTQLLLGRNPPQDVKRRLETMLSEGQRIVAIVKNLLTFARKHPPEKKYLGLNGIIEKTLELKAYHFRVSQIKVEKDLAPELPKTMVDYHQFQQVLINLFNNAEHAMVGTGRGGMLRLTTRAADGRIEVRVSDDGPGIPEEIQDRIFEPFFTTKKEGVGTGLGLSLCFGIVQQHGGAIRVESRPGAGTTFVIDLPIIADAASPEQAAPGEAPRPTGRLRILVIEDEPTVQDLLVDFLTARGHAVDTASDVPEALRKIGQKGLDLVISDMKMPHGSGKDVYRALVSGLPNLAQRIIFTTGDGANAETRTFLEEARAQVVLKPFRLEELEAAIARALLQ